jgi:hypothetical protein
MNSSGPNNASFYKWNVSFLETNMTSELLPAAKWTIMPVFSLLVFVFGCINNGGLLLLFVQDSSLRTPFNIYLINLLMANLACTLVVYPMDIINNLYSFAWFMGDTACTVYLYGCYVLEAGISTAHQLIAINRIWAVAHPISYRSHHSVKIAILLCLATWFYVHVVMIPGWIGDALYYRLPINTNGCLLNQQMQVKRNDVMQPHRLGVENLEKTKN